MVKCEREMDKQETLDTPRVSHDIQRNTQQVYKDMKKQPTRNIGLSDTYPHGTQHSANHEREYVPEPKGTQDFARYLIRRELVSAGLLQFDDKPENYWAWKASFLSSTKDLNLSAREELDLLTKWLGAESSEQAKRIRAVHVLNPDAGTAMVWQSLEECYGTPEVIEDALFKKIENFPRLTSAPRSSSCEEDLGAEMKGGSMVKTHLLQSLPNVPRFVEMQTAHGLVPRSA